MTGFFPAVIKLTLMFPERVRCGDEMAMIVPEDADFTEEEIEEMRQYDALYEEYNGDHIIANFLPDDVRPSNVKKL